MQVTGGDKEVSIASVASRKVFVLLPGHLGSPLHQRCPAEGNCSAPVGVSELSWPLVW